MSIYIYIYFFTEGAAVCDSKSWHRARSKASWWHHFLSLLSSSASSCRPGQRVPRHRRRHRRVQPPPRPAGPAAAAARRPSLPGGAVWVAAFPHNRKWRREIVTRLSSGGRHGRVRSWTTLTAWTCRSDYSQTGGGGKGEEFKHPALQL